MSGKIKGGFSGGSFHVRTVEDKMKYLFDNIPIVIVIVGICLLMLYPYIGAGLMLAALCFEAEQYVLMTVSFLICVLLQSIMGKHIKPHHVPVKPSRASRRRNKKKKREMTQAQKTAEKASGEGAGNMTQAQRNVGGDSDGGRQYKEE